MFWTGRGSYKLEAALGSLLYLGVSGYQGFVLRKASWATGIVRPTRAVNLFPAGERNPSVPAKARTDERAVVLASFVALNRGSLCDLVQELLWVKLVELIPCNFTVRIRIIAVPIQDFPF
jgi:hypothetical protein